MRQGSILLLLAAATFCSAQSGNPPRVNDNSDQQPLSLSRKDEQRLQGPLKAPGVTASVNKVLLVTAPPYDAKCDGKTDDQSAIQAAFNDARTNGDSIQFPAGTCKTSTITWYGQPFFGAGLRQTTILGLSGQDVFQTPDSAATLQTNAVVRDLTIRVDNTVNKAAAAGGGDNTFPNRISGTAGGTTPLASNYGGPPAPGGIVYGAYNGSVIVCSGSMTSGSSSFTLSCGNFNQVDPSFFVGQPITVIGAGTSGGTLTTTVSAVVNGTTLTLAARASTTTTAASGTIGNGITPPWYFGNCGIALPESSGTAQPGGENGWLFRNLQIQAINGGLGANHSCGIFQQANSYNVAYENVNVVALFGGIIEAPPASNNTSYFAWTPDTDTYTNVNLEWDIIPLVWYNGTHRDVNGLNIYGGMRPFMTGIWQLATPLGTSATVYPSATFSQFYDEGWANASGEYSRYTGPDIINGGNLDQISAPAAYINWVGSSGTSDAQIGIPLHISGNSNTFSNTNFHPGYVTDSGYENTVEAGIQDSDPAAKRKYFANPTPPQDPVGKLDGAFLLSGNSSTPYVSGSDLMTTCRDYHFATGDNSKVKCTHDGDGVEVSRSFFRSPGSLGFGTGVDPHTSFLMTAGSRVPLTRVYVVTQGRCAGSTSCSSYFKIRDLTAHATILKTCQVTYGNSWTIQGGPSSTAECLVDFSGTPYGDVIGWDFNNFSGNPSEVDLAFVAFQPLNQDALSMLRSGAFLPGRTNAVGGAPLAPGSCASGTAAVADAASGMAVDATPAADPGDGFVWKAYVGNPGVVTVKVCNFTAGAAAPRPTAYNVRVLQ